MAPPVNLKQQVRQTGTRKRFIEINAIEPTKALIGDLARAYLPVVRIWENHKQDLLSEYSRTLQELSDEDRANEMLRDSPDAMQFLIETINSLAVQAQLSFRGDLELWLNRTALWHMRKFTSQIKYASNVDVSTQVSVGDTRTTMNEFLLRNVNLIRNVNDETRSRISEIIFRGFTNRTSLTEIAREISKATGMARDRSLRIASDQTVKLSAKLDEERQKQMGMDSFRWMHSGKVHYRPEHKARNNKIFAWSSDVGKKDPPGFLPFCGCKAKGILPLYEDFE